jgi:serine-type D-Ala-D-Ala carboxypeptidase (penicillin-binding protein 5/6)
LNIKKKIIIPLLLISVLVGFLPTVSWAVQTPPEISAEAAILIDMKTGEVLYEKNADKVMEPASITKVLTGLLVIENLNLDDKVAIEENLNVPGNGMSLLAGEVLTVRDLLYGMLIHSANDAAVVLSRELAATKEEFNQMAEARANQIGATHTIITTPSGLNDVKGNVTTARDLAMICKEAMKNPIFRDAVSTVKITIPANLVSSERVYLNTNIMLYDTKTKLVVNGIERTPKYDGIIGIKTGETSTAGSCVVAAAKRDGTELMAVILNAPDKDSRFADSIALLDFGYNNYYTYEAITSGVEVDKIKIPGSSKLRVAAVAPEGYFITLPKEASATLVTQKILLKNHLSAPLDKGATLGTISFYLAGEKIGEVAIVAADEVEVGGPWTNWGISDLVAYVTMALIGIGLLILLISIRVRMKKKKMREKRKRIEEARLAREQEEIMQNKRKRDWPY